MNTKYENCEKNEISVISASADWARSILPHRPENSNKGSFGKLLIIAGSNKYRGAAVLALESALRSGVGYVMLSSVAEVNRAILPRFPETVFFDRKDIEEMNDVALSELLSLAERADGVLIGAGCGKSATLAHLILKLLECEGAPLLIDADGLNSLAELPDRGVGALASAVRDVVLTPHLLEFSRLTGMSVDEISADRIKYATEYARDAGAVLVLKGHGTVTTDGNRAIVNKTGGTSLSKAGSGDCLAGLVAGLVSSKYNVPLEELVALGVYLHGAAADTLAKDLSEFGTTPSDLPQAMAKEIVKIK